MSVKKDIWTGLKVPLLALKNAGTIKHYAIWNNQIELETNEIPFLYPAIFTDMNIIWDRTGLKSDNNVQWNKQIGTCILTLRCAFEKYVNETTSFDEIDSVLDLIIEKFHLLDICQYTTVLLRSAERIDGNHNNIIIHEIDFTCQIQETFANTGVQDATAGDPTKLSLILTGTL